MTAATTAPAHLQGWRRRSRHALRRAYAPLIGYALLAPLVLWMLVVLVYPIGNLLALSLTDTRIVGAPSAFVGLDNYQATLLSARFWSAVQRSIVWLLGNVVLGTVVAFAAALLLRQSWRPAQQARVWILLPWVIPTVAVAVIWQWMLNANYGVINFVLTALDVIAAPLNVFGSKELTMAGTIIANTWHWFPLSAVVIFGAMQNIPQELYEAARLDGASAWAQFRFITLPATAKTMFALGLVGGLWTLNVFDTIYLVTRGGPADATLTLPVLIYETAFKGLRIGQAAAMSVVAIGLLAALATAYARLMAPKE
ncbi:carbohydrate ABC transporter permease [Labrys wisconsinensis]|uniref:Multiple sugar transport system permease protein n=1 Tax=Labrys wisconsinensis TaxID=425677 RepID=A0ABU0JP88_9HYPH|nr:sugar ABC transporter permease [Labrys wisconsinensis]MDQ0475306.1 multiple sugar transport system permease protein [Labrys wisconsinensis]